MFPCKIGSVFVLAMLSIGIVNGQRTISVEKVMELSFERSDLMKAADASIDHSRLMEKSGGFIPDPQLTLESPTGQYMTLGVQQTFAFPTVYVKQKQLAREQTVLSEKSRILTAAELRKRIKLAYLEWQTSEAERDLLAVQDSMLFKIAEAADRQYEAGQIDFIERAHTRIRYSDVHALFAAAEIDAAGKRLIVQSYTGIGDSISPTELKKFESDFVLTNHAVDSSALLKTPIMAYHKQNELISEKAIQLQRNRVFPNMTVGYMNQSTGSTPFPLRLQFGLSVPLWFWQHSTSINASKKMLSISRSRTAAGALELSQQWTAAKVDARKYDVALKHYENAGLPEIQSMIKSADRMFSAGKYDYVKYVTTLSSAFETRLKYISLVRNYNQAIISLEYLTGQ